MKNFTQDTFTQDEFTTALTAAVAERGEDYVYPKGKHGWSVAGACVYRTLSGEPACIIGAALSKIDPDLVPPATSAASANDVLAALTSMSTANAARAAQIVQDQGGTWGEALRAYLDYLTAPTQKPVRNLPTVTA